MDQSFPQALIRNPAGPSLPWLQVKNLNCVRASTQSPYRRGKSILKTVGRLSKLASVRRASSIRLLQKSLLVASLGDIQRAFQASWPISCRATISEIWDSRHILIILDSESDVRTALSSSLNKVGHAYFSLFRWTPKYNPKRKSTITNVWVRLPGLLLPLYDNSFIGSIVSIIWS